jgi:ATP-binding cassette, subfamily B, multidrug efflux pump
VILGRIAFYQQSLDTPCDVLPQRAAAFVRVVARLFGWVLALRIVLEGMAALLAAVQPYILKRVIDVVAEGPTASTLPAPAWDALLLYAVAGFVGTLVLAHLARTLDTLLLQPCVTPLVRRWLYERQLGQSLAAFHNASSGGLASQTLEAAWATHKILTSLSGSFVWSPVAIATGVYLFWNAHTLLLVPIALWTLAYGGVQYLHIRQLDTLSAAAARLRSRVSGRIVDTFGQILTVKLFAQQRHEHAAIVEEMQAQRAAETRLYWGYFKLDVSSSVLEYALDISTLIIAVLLRTQNVITTGDIVMAMALVQIVRNNVRYLSREVSEIVDSKGQLQQALDELVQPLTVQDADDAKDLDLTHGQVEFRNVAFRYSPQGPVVLHEFELTIPAGQKVGLVGRSGAGKSTLVNLLLRFYDVDTGTIRIDGQDLRQVTQDSLRGQIAMVTQDTSLLHRSVAENIGYGKAGARREQIVAAAEQAHAHEFIVGLTDNEGRTGYDAHVGERGVKLSGGQRQRIAIARLMLKNAPILILDEATSALDSEAEAVIQENLTTLMAGKTVIAIAHRLSTIAKLDRLIVLDNGRIVEDGSHGELLARGGLYAQLWARQTDGFLRFAC